MKVLVVGGGGREHALCWALSRAATVWCCPGNPGTAQCATNLPIPVDDHAAVLEAVAHHRIDLTVVGPEAPLAAGLGDRLTEAGHAVFGPSARAARIEASKAFAKEVMARASVPTAAAEAFTDAARARSYIMEHREPIVIKASGLAAGKGVVVCDTRRQAVEAAEGILAGRFGQAGSTVLVEDFLEGEELSVLALTDGEHVVMLPASQDHKRLLEKDLGPNTGGMGAYCPVTIATPDLMTRVEHEIIGPTLREMANRGAPYAGVLYVGIMVDGSGNPAVVEFNCRFGDPEAQVVLPIVGEHILEPMRRIAAGETLAPFDASAFRSAAVTTVLASAGYPDAPEKGAPITLPDHDPSDGILFHAGTKQDDDVLRVAGGRVLCATGLGQDMPSALDASRRLAESVDFPGKVFRRDIGWREIARAGAA